MLRNQLEALNNEINIREKNSLLHKLLPFMLILSFAFLELFSIYSTSVYGVSEMIGLGDPSTLGDMLFGNILIFAVIEWLGFEVSFWFYRTILSFSVFSYTIPRELMNNTARKFMVIRNVILGVLMNLMFFFPFISTYLLIVELLIDILVFVWFVFSVMRETVDPMIKPNVFKLLVITFVVIEAISLIVLVVGAL